MSDDAPDRAKVAEAAGAVLRANGELQRHVEMRSSGDVLVALRRERTEAIALHWRTLLAAARACLAQQPASDEELRAPAESQAERDCHRTATPQSSRDTFIAGARWAEARLGITEEKP